MVFNTSNSTNLSKNEQAVVNVKFSPAMFTEIVKFEVKLNSLPESSYNREVSANWKMYDGFDPKGEFYTDSNELEMKKRVIDQKNWNSLIQIDKEGEKVVSDLNHIPANYYPVDSAIAMRDQSGSNVQVTIMNDRPQGGSADLSDKATIELMQHRR